MAVPYEKRETESIEAFAAFAVYRDQGAERSQVHAAKELKKNPSVLAKWSTKHQWPARVHAWDLEMDRRKRVGALKGVEDMRRRQTRLAEDMQELGRLELAKLMKSAKKHAKVGQLEPQEVRKLVEAGSRLERVNRGEPGEIIQNTDGDSVDLSVLSLEELKTLRAVRIKLRKAQETAKLGPEES